MDFQKGYGVTFPVMEKSDVNGGNTNEVYQYLKRNMGVDNIQWNFAKFLVNKDGDVVAFYPPQKGPADIVPDIKKVIAN